MEPALVVALVMMAGASISDLQTRRVPNRYWIPFLVAAAFFAPGVPLAAWLWSAGACAFLYGLWWFGLFGGADAKGLMVVALLLPTTPDLLDARTIVPVDALVNGTFVVVAFPVFFLLWNAVRGDVRLPAMLLGIRSERRRHMWPMQEVDGDTLRWRYLHRPGRESEPLFDALERAGIKRPWVTPKVPFMIPLAGGLWAAVTYGNLVFLGMSWLMGNNAP